MSQAKEFTDANFQSEVLNSSQPVLVDFWAAWCGPCRALAPAIDELADQFADSAKVGKLNIDENPISPANFRISSIPAVLLFKNGEVVDAFVGVQPKERIAKAIEQAAA